MMMMMMMISDDASSIYLLRLAQNKNPFSQTYRSKHSRKKTKEVIDERGFSSRAKSMGVVCILRIMVLLLLRK